MANEDRNLPVGLRTGLWNPLREIARMQRDIDRMFDQFGSPVLGSGILGTSEFVPACDIEEDDNQYRVCFDVPGLRKEDLKIEVKDNQLIVSGERKVTRTEGGSGRPLARERIHGNFVRAFSMPANVNSDQVRASYEDGVLEVLLPKSEAAKPKQIEIKVGKKAA